MRFLGIFGLCFLPWPSKHQKPSSPSSPKKHQHQKNKTESIEKLQLQKRPSSCIPRVGKHNKTNHKKSLFFSCSMTSPDFTISISSDESMSSLWLCLYVSMSGCLYVDASHVTHVFLTQRVVSCFVSCFASSFFVSRTSGCHATLEQRRRLAGSCDDTSTIQWRSCDDSDNTTDPVLVESVWIDLVWKVEMLWKSCGNDAIKKERTKSEQRDKLSKLSIHYPFWRALQIEFHPLCSCLLNALYLFGHFQEFCTAAPKSAELLYPSIPIYTLSQPGN